MDFFQDWRPWRRRRSLAERIAAIPVDLADRVVDAWRSLVSSVVVSRASSVADRIARDAADAGRRASIFADDARALSARLYRDVETRIRPRPRSWFERTFFPPPKSTTDRAREATRAALDDMGDRLADLRGAAERLGASEVVRDARSTMSRISRLRLTVSEPPASPPSAFARLVAPMSQTGSRSVAAHVVTAVAAVGALMLLQSLLSARSSASGFGESNEAGTGMAAARAMAPGRGRTAISPWQIPWAGWKDILWRTWREIGEDRLLAIAAGVVFLGLLALFPAITALVSSYGLFASPATVSEHLSFLASVMPAGSFSIVQDQVARVVANGDAELGVKFVIGLGLAIWSANAGMKAIIDALNVVYEEDEKRGFVTLNLVSLAFTVGGLFAVLLGVAGVVGIPVALQFVGLDQHAEALISLVRWPLLFVLLLAGLAVLYRYAPSRREPRGQWVSVGAIVAALAWIAGSAALSYYISRFGNYDATYGSLGAAIGLMMWMWLSAIVVLFGAELNSEIEHQTAVDSTEGVSKPLGARGAKMADSVGEAHT